MWVLEDDNGDVVGVAGLELYEKQGLLRSVAVSKGLHGQGYGTFLVKCIMDEARKSGVHEMFLLTTTAPTFFRKLGFREDNREHVTGGITNSVEYKSACPKTAILMRLALS